VVVSGIALHTGARANLRILPADVNTGIIFRRVDMPGAPQVKAHAANVIDVRRATTIASRETGAFVVTVEHVMASLHAAKIDNAIVEMDGPEPPIADGSAKSYFEGILEAGIQPQDAPAKYWSAKEPITVKEGNAELYLEPSDHFEVDCSIEFGGTSLSKQQFTCNVTTETFAKELFDSRTFCVYQELAQLIAAGLVKGGSLECAVVMHDGAIISKEGLRHPNEFVRHKMMDLVGDLYLVGARVKAKVTAVKAGHPSHVKLAQTMLAQCEPA
jgi:UDP-3-O-acyl N-acetylglucosamine deacetylase